MTHSVNNLINNFLTIRPEHQEEDRKNLITKLQIARIVTIAISTVFATFAATSIVALAPIRAAVLIGCAYFYVELNEIVSKILNKPDKSDLYWEGGLQLVKDELKDSPLISTMVKLICPTWLDKPYQSPLPRRTSSNSSSVE